MSLRSSGSVETRPRHQIHQRPDEAAVDRDLIAVHIRRPIARQEENGIRDVLWHADPSRRDDGGAPLRDAGRVVKGLAHRRDHHARTDDVAADALRTPFARKLARQHHDAGLAGAVGAAPALRMAAGYRRDMNEAAAPELADLPAE